MIITKSIINTPILCLNIFLLQTFIFKSIILTIFLSTSQAHAQCTVPTAITNENITHATCPGNGCITITSVTPALNNGDYYKYALFEKDGFTEVKPFSITNTFTNLQADTYQVRVRRFCNSSATFSNFITKTLVVR